MHSLGINFLIIIMNIFFYYLKYVICGSPLIIINTQRKWCVTTYTHTVFLIYRHNWTTHQSFMASRIHCRFIAFPFHVHNWRDFPFIYISLNSNKTKIMKNTKKRKDWSHDLKQSKSLACLARHNVGWLWMKMCGVEFHVLNSHYY